MRSPAVIHVAGGILANFTQDLMTLLVAWENLTCSACILVRGEGNARGRRISLQYLTIPLSAAALFSFSVPTRFHEIGSLAVRSLGATARSRSRILPVRARA